ncbi:MAG: cell division protein FtsA [Anaerolineales bacterium]|nr:cell division protein FtsA [Anaerolineales bacterium]
MDDSVIVGIDVGTTKVCALVGRVEERDRLRILGLGVEPSRGIRKGAVVDLASAAQTIRHAVDKAERTSGLEIKSALVSLAGAQISALNSKGVVGISGRAITEDDVARAMDAARAVAIPHNQEIIHIIQRNFTVDGQEGIRSPIGMHGYRLEVETHIITAATSTVENLRQCVADAGVEVTQFVLAPLAAAEMSLTDSEREMGVVACDIGSGTTDIAIYIEGDVWHTAILPVGGGHVTSDIAHGLRLSTEIAENIKLKHAHTRIDDVPAEEYFTVQTFGEEGPLQISRQDLAHITGARVEEIFSLVQQEIKRSGYDGLLPAGMVLTGGTALLPGIRQVAHEVLGMPVRIAQPTDLIGMTDQLSSPAFATAVGLLKWAILMNEIAIQPGGRRVFSGGMNWDKIKDVLRRLLP